LNLLLYKFDFIEVTWLDITDILIVAIILYNIYRLIRGSLAFNIFLGLMFIYIAYQVVKLLNMQLLSGLLGQFVNLGVIALLIVFQPEVRRFLLFLGKGSDSWKRIFSRNWSISHSDTYNIDEICEAFDYFSQHYIGAIIVLPRTSRLQFFSNTGVPINGKVSAQLLQSIFDKNSPLHDGAVIISGDQILSAKCILPVSENPSLPEYIGTRHRAAVGITEHSDATAIIVSEETGRISYAKGGELKLNINKDGLKNVLIKILMQD